MLPDNVHWQFCKDGFNTDQFDHDADEIRQWVEDGTLLVAFKRSVNSWYVSGSDVFDWVPLSGSPVEIDFDHVYPKSLTELI